MTTKHYSASIVLCCLLLLCIVLTASAQATANFRLYPARESSSEGLGFFSYEAQPGITIEDTIALLNAGEEPVRLQLFAADAMTASSGSVTAKTGWDETPQASGAWLNLQPKEVVLAAGEEREIPFSLVIPDQLPSGEYAASIVAQLVNETEEIGGIQFIPRFAVAVMATVSGEEPLESNLEFLGISAETSRTGHTLITQLHNSGNDGIKRITGDLTITDSNQQPVATFPIQLGYFLAGDHLNYRLDLGSLSSGSYEATFTTSYDEKELVQSAAFTLEPLEQPVLLSAELEELPPTLAPTSIIEPTATLEPTIVTPEVTSTIEPQITVNQLTPAEQIAKIGDTESLPAQQIESNSPAKESVPTLSAGLIVGLIISLALLMIAVIVTLLMLRTTKK